MTTVQINQHSAEYRIRPISQLDRLLAAARVLREAAALARYDGSFREAVALRERAERLEAVAAER